MCLFWVKKYPVFENPNLYSAIVEGYCWSYHDSEFYHTGMHTYYSSGYYPGKRTHDSFGLDAVNAVLDGKGLNTRYNASFPLLALRPLSFSAS